VRIDAKSLLKTLFHTFRSLLNNLRILEAPYPLGDVLGELFRNAILSLRIFEGARDPREEKDALEMLGLIMTLFEAHVFTEVWTNNMDFFVEQVLENPHAITILQTMLVHQDVSHQTVAILLKYLMGRLEVIGNQDKTRSSLTLKLFKLSFMAVNSYIELNEPVLVPHLAKLIIDSFGYAAKSPDPIIYYQILRALFR
jgi:transformation/transcription domain-associated protein